MSRRLLRMRALGLAVWIITASHQTIAVGQTPAAGAPLTTMTLDVDASDAPMKILHATVAMPAKVGAMTLFYPKWIPGEHMASGPIANLTGLHIFADAREIDWRRDLHKGAGP